MHIKCVVCITDTQMYAIVQHIVQSVPVSNQIKLFAQHLEHKRMFLVQSPQHGSMDNKYRVYTQ